MAEKETKIPAPRALCNLVGKSLGRDQRVDKKGNATGFRLIDKTGEVVDKKWALHRVVPPLQEHLDWCEQKANEVLGALKGDEHAELIRNAELIRRADQMIEVAARLREEIHGLNGNNYKTHRGDWWEKHFDEHNEPVATEGATGGEEVLGTIFKQLDLYINETQKRRQSEAGNATGNVSAAVLPHLTHPSDGVPTSTAEEPLVVTAVQDGADLFRCHEDLGDLLSPDDIADMLDRNGSAPDADAWASSTTWSPAAAAPSPAHPGVALGVASEPADRMGAVGGQSTQAHAAHHASPSLPYMPPPLGNSMPATASADQPVDLPQGTSLETVSPSLLGGAPPATTPATTALAAPKRPRAEAQAQGTYDAVYQAISNPDVHAFDRTGEANAANLHYYRAKLEEPGLVKAQIDELRIMVHALERVESMHANVPPAQARKYRSLSESPPDTDHAVYRAISNPNVHAFDRTGQVLPAVLDDARAKLRDPDLNADQEAELTESVHCYHRMLSMRAHLPQEQAMQWRSLSEGPPDTDGPAPPSSCWRSLLSPPPSQAFRSLSIEG